MRIVLFVLIEQPGTVPVNRLQVRLDTGGFVRLRAGIAADEQGLAAQLVLFPDERDEDLLIERILQAVVLDQVEHRGGTADPLSDLVVPIDEGGVRHAVHESLEHVVRSLDLSDQADGFEGASVFPLVRGGGVSVAD